MGLIAWKQKALLYVSRATLIIISLLLHTPGYVYFQNSHDCDNSWFKCKKEQVTAEL